MSQERIRCKTSQYEIREHGLEPGYFARVKLDGFARETARIELLPHFRAERVRELYESVFPFALDSPEFRSSSCCCRFRFRTVGSLGRGDGGSWRHARARVKNVVRKSVLFSIRDVG